MTRRVECGCPRARHRHGTRAMHDNCGTGCRCTPCRAAASNARNAYRNGGDPREGWSDLVPGVGTRRRLQALAAIGVPLGVIADRLGMKFQHVSRLRNRDHVRADTAARVAEVYDSLWNAPAYLRRTKTRTWATRQGWVPPLAWDDDTIDDPAAYPRTSPPIGPTCTDCAHPSCEVIRPQLDEVAVEEAARGRAVYLTPAERQVAVERLTARGQSAREIADLLNTSPRTVQRKRAAA